MTSTLLLAQTWLIVVGGLGGEPRYSAAFQEQAQALLTTAREHLAVPDERIIYLSEFTSPRVSAAAVDTALSRVARQASAEATVVIVLLGHGSAVGGRARFHLPGPDLDAQRFASLLARFPTQRLLIVNAASASGPWVKPLAGPRRIVITATRSAAERNETVFPRYFVTAFADSAADLDKNGRVSVLEAFTFARQGVIRFYADGRRIATEHALLEDDGDGAGTLEPAADGTTDGATAALFYLDAGAAGAPGSVVAALMARRDSLEAALADLRTRRASMAATDYESALEALLVEIARVGRELRARRGGTEP